MSKIAPSIYRKKYEGWFVPAIGLINIYSPSLLEAKVATISAHRDDEIVYLTLDTANRAGFLGRINDSTEDVAIRRLEVEMMRTAKEFFGVAQKLDFSESALDLILLLKKEAGLSSSR